MQQVVTLLATIMITNTINYDLYFTTVLSTVVKYTAPKYHGINTMVILQYFPAGHVQRREAPTHPLFLYPYFTPKPFDVERPNSAW